MSLEASRHDGGNVLLTRIQAQKLVNLALIPNDSCPGRFQVLQNKTKSGVQSGMTPFGRSKITDGTAPCANGFHLNRRSLPLFGAGAAFAATGLRPARAQDYPARPVQMLVPFAGGSAGDVVTRILLNGMSTSLGQAFVVDNRPGGVSPPSG